MNTPPGIRLRILRAVDRGLVPFALIFLFLAPTVPALSSRLSNVGVFHFVSARLDTPGEQPSPKPTPKPTPVESPVAAPGKPPVATPGESPVVTPAATPVPDRFKFEPSQVSRNSTHTVKITSNNCTTNKFEALDKVITKTEIDDYKNKGIEITPKTLDSPDLCVFTAVLTVTDAAAFQDVMLTFHYKGEGNADKTETIRITMVKEEALPPGPIPPGLKPEVDIMWGVVPQKVVKDNFGRRVGQNFYCIEVVIGNNSGYALQIASVGFKLGPVGDAAKYMAERIKQTSADIGGSPEVSEAITAQRQAAVSVGDAAKLEAEAEIARRMSLIDPGKVKDYQTKKARADGARAKAEGDAKIANVKKQAALAVVKDRVELVREEAAQLTELSRLAYTQVVPVGSYMMTRGSLEHGQIWSPRNFVLNGVRAFGPFLTGFVPFFHNLNHRSNFSEGINIFSNPFEKGIEALMPDETIAQLQRLDEQILRDGVIIPNNRQIRTRVFVAKETLRLKKDLNGNDMRDDPMIVTLALGEMYLIGNTISYLNRVSVTSGPSGEVVPPPTVNPNSYEKELPLGATQTFTLTGTSLKDALLTSDEPDEVEISGITTTSTSLTGQVTIKDTARLGQHTLNVTNARGTVPITITVTQPLPKDPKLDATPSIASLPAEQKPYSVTIKGRFLQGGDLVAVDSAGVKNPLTSRNMKATPDGTSLSGDIVVPPGTQKGSYSFAVTNEQHKDTKESLPLVAIPVGEPAVPKITIPTPPVDPIPVRRNPIAAKSYKVTLTGENLNNANDVEKPQNATNFVFAGLTPSSNGRELTMTVTVPAGQAADSYKFKLKYGPAPAQPAPDEFTIKVEAQEPVTKVSPSTETVLIPTAGSQTLVINGEHLEGATVKETTPDTWTVTPVKNPNDSASQMPVKIKAPTGFGPTSSPATLRFSIVNTDTTKPVEVTVTAKPEPTPIALADALAITVTIAIGNANTAVHIIAVGFRDAHIIRPDRNGVDQPDNRICSYADLKSVSVSNAVFLIKGSS